MLSIPHDISYLSMILHLQDDLTEIANVSNYLKVFMD